MKLVGTIEDPIVSVEFRTSEAVPLLSAILDRRDKLARLPKTPEVAAAISGLEAMCERIGKAFQEARR